LDNKAIFNGFFYRKFQKPCTRLQPDSKITMKRTRNSTCQYPSRFWSQGVSRNLLMKHTFKLKASFVWNLN